MMPHVMSITPRMRVQKILLIGWAVSMVCLLILLLLNEKNWRPLKGKAEWEAFSNFDPALAGAAIDQSLDTAWAPFVPMGFGMYFQIDLKTLTAINGLVLHGNAKHPDHPEHWVIKTSPDGITWNTVPPRQTYRYRSLLAILLPATQARYVQMILTADAESRWEIYEVDFLRRIVPWQYDRSSFIAWLLGGGLVLLAGLWACSLSDRDFSNAAVTFIFLMLGLTLLCGWWLRQHDLPRYELSETEWQQFDRSDFGRYTNTEWLIGFFHNAGGVSWLAGLFSRWAYAVCQHAIVAIRLVPTMLSISTACLVLTVWPIFFTDRRATTARDLQWALWKRIAACGVCAVAGYPIWLSRKGDLAAISVFFILLYLALAYHVLYRQSRWWWALLLAVLFPLGISLDPAFLCVPVGIWIFGGLHLLIHAVQHRQSGCETRRYAVFLAITLPMCVSAIVVSPMLSRLNPIFSFDSRAWLLEFSTFRHALRMSGFTGLAFWLFGLCAMIGAGGWLVRRQHGAVFFMTQIVMYAVSVTLVFAPANRSSGILAGTLLICVLCTEGLQRILAAIVSSRIFQPSSPRHAESATTLNMPTAIMGAGLVSFLLYFAIFSANTLFIGFSAFPGHADTHQTYQREKRLEDLLRHTTADTDDCKTIGVLDPRFEEVYQTVYAIPAYFVSPDEMYRVSEFNRFWRYLFVPENEEFSARESLRAFLERYYLRQESSAYTTLYQLKAEYEHAPQFYKAEHLVPMTGYKISDHRLAGADVIRATPTEEPGVLALTPAYRTCAWGKYTAEFILRAPRANGNERVAILEIVADRHLPPLGQLELTGAMFAEQAEYQVFRLPFVLDETDVNPAFPIKRLRALVHFIGETEVRLAGIHIIPDS